MAQKVEFKVFFVFDNKYAVSGAQHEETFREKTWKKYGPKGNSPQTQRY
jgi:predicted DsbA family dithiol-disulfide isomerase